MCEFVETRWTPPSDQMCDAVTRLLEEITNVETTLLMEMDVQDGYVAVASSQH